MKKIAVIIPAGGKGLRMGSEKPKTFIEIAGLPIIQHTIRKFTELPEVSTVVVSVLEEWKEQIVSILKQECGLKVRWQVVRGGKERQDSIQNAIDMVSDEDVIAVHDAVRPFFEIEVFRLAISYLDEWDGAILATPSKDTVKIVRDGELIIETPDRSTIWLAQTPQVFRTQTLKEAYKLASEQNFKGTDDASLVENLGKKVRVVEGNPENIKITYPSDLIFATDLLR